MAKHDLGTANAAEFEQWRSRSPGHAIAFARACAAWEQLDAVHQDEADIAYAGAGSYPSQARSAISRRRLLRAAGVSGAILAAAGGFFTEEAYAWDRAETRVGETRRLRLPDGSLMVLNTDSAVAWRFRNEAHIVWLDRGEIALEVAPTSVMLSLTSSRLSAQLSAGRFNARLKKDVLDVVVIRGVAQSPGRLASSGVMAARNQTLTVMDTAAKVGTASIQTLAATVAWPTGEILLHDEPLSSAVAEYNRYLPLKMVVADPDLGSIRVGGRFTSADPTAFLEALHATLGIDVQTNSSGYILTRKKFT